MIKQCGNSSHWYHLGFNLASLCSHGTAQYFRSGHTDLYCERLGVKMFAQLGPVYMGVRDPG